jgi:hypothetical protein
MLEFSPPVIPNIDTAGLLKLFGQLPKFPTDFKIQRGKSWIHDGVEISELSWSTGYGPRTEAFLLRPANVNTPLPGALFLHSHDDVKEFGKEKVVDGAGDLPESAAWVKRDHYGNRGAANALAKKGFAVLAFDCFMWGSRSLNSKICQLGYLNYLEPKITNDSPLCTNQLRYPNI